LGGSGDSATASSEKSTLQLTPPLSSQNELAQDLPSVELKPVNVKSLERENVSVPKQLSPPPLIAGEMPPNEILQRLPDRQTFEREAMQQPETPEPQFSQRDESERVAFVPQVRIANANSQQLGNQIQLRPAQQQLQSQQQLQQGQVQQQMPPQSALQNQLQLQSGQRRPANAVNIPPMNVLPNNTTKPSNNATPSNNAVPSNNTNNRSSQTVVTKTPLRSGMANNNMTNNTTNNRNTQQQNTQQKTAQSTPVTPPQNTIIQAKPTIAPAPVFR
jgi:hypothetical protein